MGLWLDPSASRDGLVREKTLFLLQTESPYLGPSAHCAVALPTVVGNYKLYIRRCTWGQRKEHILTFLVLTCKSNCIIGTGAESCMQGR